MTHTVDEKPLTQEEKDALPLTRKQALQIFDELANYLTMIPNSPISLRTMKERVREYITLAPIPQPKVVFMDGGGSFEAIGRRQVSDMLRQQSERDLAERGLS